VRIGDVRAWNAPSHSFGPLASRARLAAERPTVGRGGVVMNWRRVLLSVVFSVFVTALGPRLPLELGTVFLLPGQAVGKLLGFSVGGPRASWLTVWLTVYAQLFFWVLVWETVRVLWGQLRAWEARRAVRV
jgi:hypothetical protein